MSPLTRQVHFACEADRNETSHKLDDASMVKAVFSSSPFVLMIVIPHIDLPPPPFFRKNRFTKQVTMARRREMYLSIQYHKTKQEERKNCFGD